MRTFGRFLYALRRDWWLLVLIMVIVTGGAWVATRQQTPVYQSSASLLFQEGSDRVGPSAQVDIIRLQGGGGQLDTDLAILRSRQIAEAVIDSLAAMGESFQAKVGPGAADMLRSNVFVARVDPRAQVVVVQFRHEDPRVAALVPNVYAEQFIKYKLQVAQTESGGTVEFLRQQVGAYEGQLHEAEENLRVFREQSQVVNLEEEANQQISRLAQLQATRDEIGAELSSLSRLLTQAETGSTGGVSPYRQLASFPSFLSNRAVQDLLASLMDLENRRSELLVRRTPENTDVVALDGRIAELETQLYQLATNYRNSLSSQFSSLEASLGSFQRDLALVPAKELQFARFARDREMLAGMYALLQQRLKEAEIQNAAVPATVRVLDPALTPSAPVSPRPLVNLMLGLAVGLLLGLASIFTRGQLDRTVRTQEDAEDAALDFPVLGVIPAISSASSGQARVQASSNGRRLQLPVPLRSIRTSVRQRPRLVMLDDPRAAAAEAFRGLQDSLHTIARGKPLQTIVVTSVLPGDGKSTTAANLAISFAEEGFRTLLIDADLRRGRLGELFDLPAGPGLRDVIRDPGRLGEAVHSAPRSHGLAGLHILPAGHRGASNATDRAARRTVELLETLREQFDVIVLDSPPVGVFSDTLLLAAEADAVILVARVGATPRAPLAQSVQQISQLPTPIRGLVLNDVPVAEYSRQVYAAYEIAGSA